MRGRGCTLHTDRIPKGFGTVHCCLISTTLVPGGEAGRTQRAMARHAHQREPPSLRPTASERAHRTPNPPAARRRPGCALARRARPPTPHGSAGCRRRGCHLSSTASRSCTQRAAEAPAVAADRSLSGRCRLRSSRPAEPDLFRAKRARGAAGPHAAALSRPLQPSGQRSHGTTEERGSRQSASMSARPSRPYRRSRAHAAAQRRSGLKRPPDAPCTPRDAAACRVNCVTVAATVRIK